jgi:heptosyltransferase-2
VSAEKILVIGPSWVGDMVMAQSLFMALKNNHPQCQIDVLAPAWSLPLLERMPEVTQGIVMPLIHGQLGLRKRFQLGKNLRASQYTHAIVLPNSWKSALIPYFAKIPLRTGYRGEIRWGLLNDVRLLDKKKLSMTVQRFVSLGLASNAQQPPDFLSPAFKIEEKNKQSVTQKFKITKTAKIMALCPGAEYGPAKQWPAEHYAEVAKQKIADNWSVWIFGSDKDTAFSSQINQMTSNECVDFSSKTTLAEAIDLMAQVDVVVTNDSGLMHVGAALDKKVIALYGSSDPGCTPPLNDNAKVIDLSLDCSPCFKRECPLGHTRCLTDILPHQVLTHIEA